MKTSGGIFDLPRKNEELKALYEKRDAPNFWTDQKAAQAVIDQITLREKPISILKSIESSFDDVNVLFELAEEEHDESTLEEVSSTLDDLEKKFDDFEFQLRLGGRDDMA